MTHLERIFSTAGFMPHGMCYLWRPGILGLHVISDSLIALAYFSIPFTLVYFARKRSDLRFSWILVCFAIFIIACGTSHFMEIWTIWYPTYWLSGGVKAATALASVPTAILLIKLVPVALRVPSASALEALNAALVREIAERRRAEEDTRRLNESLEVLVDERTEELAGANLDLLAKARERAQTDELLSSTFSSIQDGVVVTDSQGAITFVNEAAARMIGQEPTKIIGSPVCSILNIIHEATRDRIDPQGAMNPEQNSIPENLLLVHGGGHEISINLRATPLRTEAEIRGMVYTLRDCTERKRADEVQQRMAALVESAEDAIIVKSLDGVIRSWNPAAERLLNYRADEIIGEPITRLLPDDRQEEESLIVAEVKRGERVAHFETVRRRKNGSLVDVSLTVSPIRDGTGAIVGASKIMRDITERKQYVEELRRLNAELEARVIVRTAEIKERDVMMQEIHHRVKNNLQVISSLINMQVRSIQDEAVRAALQQSQSRVETMAQIHEMLYQSKDYAHIPFWRYAEGLATRVLTATVASPAGVTIKYRMEQFFLPVNQAIPCGLILNELISNALKHAFPTGIGTVDIEFRRLEAVLVRLSVSDNGIGMSPEFDPAKSNSLGMALVRALVKQLDGTLDILRHPGTSFRITFPSSAKA